MYSPPTSFFPYPFYGLCSSSTCNPGIILGQDFLTACLMGQDILPAMAPADFHDWLNRVKRIPLQTDGQPRVIPAQSVQQPFGRIEFTIVLADMLSSKLPSTSFQLFRQNKNTPGTKKFDVFSITLFAAWGFCGIISFCNMKTGRNPTDQSFVPAHNHRRLSPHGHLL